MRTTITLDDDVAARLIELQRQTGRSFKIVVNKALGLEQRPCAPKTLPPPFKQQRARSASTVGELIEQTEAPAHPCR
ncbi:MAG: CopG family transcriptional regulator [Anaerolineae bacterium]|nr:ribbon-helix-helix domain-containing protein [Thermoflexales bacterium]MDW8407143.1 CopG family transcriptional regulator [Anaerolineae bacterium]